MQIRRLMVIVLALLCGSLWTTPEAGYVSQAHAYGHCCLTCTEDDEPCNDQEVYSCDCAANGLTYWIGISSQSSKKCNESFGSACRCGDCAEAAPGFTDCIRDGQGWCLELCYGNVVALIEPAEKGQPPCPGQIFVDCPIPQSPNEPFCPHEARMRCETDLPPCPYKKAS